MSNKKQIKKMTLFAIMSFVAIFTLTGFLGIERILNFEGLLKTAGIGIVVSKFGPQINHSVNSLTGHKDHHESKTKVVPILTLGSKAAIGAVQVMGPQSQLDQVSAVAQLETGFFRVLRVRALVPIAGRDLKKIHRIKNVGVSAIIDAKL